MPNVTGSAKNVTHATAGLASDPGNSVLSSTEQLYSPIYIVRGGGGAGAGVSSFEPALTSGASNGQFGASHLGPTRDELDPYFSNFLGDSGQWIQSNDFQFMGNNGTGPNGADTNIGKLDRSSVSAVGVTHFRGPMCVSGIGTDLADRPFPAVSSTGEDSWKLNPVAVNDRSTWPAGPVDLKWDEQRKVWSGGPHIVCGVAKVVPAGDLCSPPTFSVRVLRLENGIGGSPPLSNTLFGETINVTNFDQSLEEEAAAGKNIFVIAARINYLWIPIWVGCPDCSDAVGDDSLPCPQDSCALG